METPCITIDPEKKEAEKKPKTATNQPTEDSHSAPIIFHSQLQKVMPTDDDAGFTGHLNGFDA